MGSFSDQRRPRYTLFPTVQDEHDFVHIPEFRTSPQSHEDSQFSHDTEDSQSSSLLTEDVGDLQSDLGIREIPDNSRYNLVSENTAALYHEAIATLSDRSSHNLVVDRDVDSAPTPSQEIAQEAFSQRTPLVNSKSTSEKNKKKRRPLSGWWWWEIGASLLSIISMALLVVLLLQIDNTALSSWPYGIQINTVIAILTAAARTAMLVPIAACISQLKWRHFERPNRLVHLQLYDNASRGPWGSFVILFKLRTRDLLVWALAFCTILTLGIGPSAQQIVEFPTRQVQLSNVSAVISRANSYASKEPFQLLNNVVPDNMFHPPEVGIPFQTKLRSGLMGSPFVPDFLCPAPAIECAWEDFSTLSLCADVRNVTTETVVNCTTSDQYLACDYTYNTNNQTHAVQETISLVPVTPSPNIITVEVPSTTRTSSAPSSPSTITKSVSDNQTSTTASSETTSTGTTPEPEFSIAQVSAPASGRVRKQAQQMLEGVPLHISRNSLAVRLRSDVFDPMTGDIDATYAAEHGTDPPPMDVYYFAWEWCEKTFQDVTASGGKVHVGSTTTQRLQTLEPKSDWFSTSGFPSDRNLDVYRSSSSSSSSSATGQQYLVGQRSAARLEQLRDMFFDQQVVRSSNNTMDGAVDFGMFMYRRDFAELVNNYADTTNNIVHEWNSNLNATNHTGRAYTPETFVRVRWAWMILPLAEAVGAVVLLAASIAATRRQPLVKDSALAPLFYGPGWDGWPPRGDGDGDGNGGGEEEEEEELGRGGRRRGVSAPVFEEVSKRMVATLEEDRDGRPRFKMVEL